MNENFYQKYLCTPLLIILIIFFGVLGKDAQLEIDKDVKLYDWRPCKLSLSNITGNAKRMEKNIVCKN